MPTSSIINSSHRLLLNIINTPSLYIYFKKLHDQKTILAYWTDYTLLIPMLETPLDYSIKPYPEWKLLAGLVRR